MRARALSTRSGDASVDARHAEAVRARERSWKTVAVAVLRWGSWLAVFAVLDIGRKTVDLFSATTRLQINELHLSFEATSLFLQIFVLKLLFLELVKKSVGHTGYRWAERAMRDVGDTHRGRK